MIDFIQRKKEYAKLRKKDIKYYISGPLEAANLVLFYKQMLVSTRRLQLNNYIITTHKILQVLRENYSLEE